jgi:hypothetical protein
MTKEPKLTALATDSPDDFALRDRNPGIEQHHSQTPEHVDHAMDFRAMRYQRTALFRNDDPYAESDTSQASEGFLVRRTDSGAWEAQRVARNFSTLDRPGEWEPVPARLATAWEEAWQRRPR